MSSHVGALEKQLLFATSRWLLCACVQLKLGTAKKKDLHQTSERPPEPERDLPPDRPNRVETAEKDRRLWDVASLTGAVGRARDRDRLRGAPAAPPRGRRRRRAREEEREEPAGGGVARRRDDHRLFEYSLKLDSNLRCRVSMQLARRRVWAARTATARRMSPVAQKNELQRAHDQRHADRTS